MDNLDMISDDDLRRRLMQYGFPNLPVTATSRKILIKKLRNYMDNEKLKLRRETSYATRYSSDEDMSDRETKRKGRSTISHTTYNSSMPPPLMKTTKRSVASAISRPVASISNKIPIQSRNSVFIPVPINRCNDTDENSDYNSHNDICNTSTSFSSVNNNFASTSGLSPQKRLSPAIARPNPSAFNNENNFASSNFRSSYINASAMGRKHTPSPLNGHSAEESPFLSEFTKRLLNLRGTTVSETKPRFTEPSRTSNTFMRTKNYSDLSLHDDGSIIYQAETIVEPSQVPVTTAFSNFINKLDEHYGVKHTFVPCILLSALIIFFALVAFMYMTISPDLANTLNPKETVYTLCLSGTDMGSNSYSCIEKSQVDNALDLLRITATELQKRVELNRCTDSSMPYAMNAKEIINYAIDKNPALHVVTARKYLHNMEYLIHMNPQWHINHCDASGHKLTFDEVVNLRNSQENYFAILNPRLPFTCSLYNKLQTFFLFVGGAGLCFITIYACHFLFQLVVSVHQTRKEKVNILISDIINALMEKSVIDPGNPSTSLIVVNHLRDKLIPPSDRSKMEWAWSAAMNFLEQNESRIQFEIANRNGEDCKMMRWIDTVSPHISPRSSVKQWQSPAFDKTNKIKDPPTPCLKIRQMFDKYEANNPNLKQIIQDAILEKVGSDCKIYDIELDKNSCCVYVRCATSRDAGIVHDQINGWWFDSRLVSIKFLRLDRYLNRFPKSPAGPTCLRPSNTKNLSMSNCFNEVNGLEHDDAEMGEDD